MARSLSLTVLAAFVTCASGFARHLRIRASHHVPALLASSMRVDSTNSSDYDSLQQRRALSRLAHKQRTASLRSLYNNPMVRQAAYTTYSAAAADAAGTRHFGWLGYEALVAKYGEEEAEKLLAKARQALREQYSTEQLAALARKGHSTAAANAVRRTLAPARPVLCDAMPALDL